MKKLALFALSVLSLSACHVFEKERILLVYDTASAQSDTVRQQVSNIMSVAADENIRVDTTSNLAYLSEDSIKQYQALVLVGVPGDNLDYRKQTDLERYVQAGGGVVGVGTDLATKFQWPWREKLVARQANRPAHAGMVHEDVIPDSTEAKPMLVGNHTYDGGRLYFLADQNATGPQLAEALEYTMRSGCPTKTASCALCWMIS
jgi:hypothetical protein